MRRPPKTAGAPKKSIFEEYPVYRGEQPPIKPKKSVKNKNKKSPNKKGIAAQPPMGNAEHLKGRRVPPLGNPPATEQLSDEEDIGVPQTPKPSQRAATEPEHHSQGSRPPVVNRRKDKIQTATPPKSSGPSKKFRQGGTFYAVDRSDEDWTESEDEEDEDDGAPEMDEDDVEPDPGEQAKTQLGRATKMAEATRTAQNAVLKYETAWKGSQPVVVGTDEETRNLLEEIHEIVKKGKVPRSPNAVRRDIEKPKGSGSKGEILREDFQETLWLFGETYKACRLFALEVYIRSGLDGDTRPWRDKVFENCYVASFYLSEVYPVLYRCVGDWGCKWLLQTRNKNFNKSWKHNEKMRRLEELQFRAMSKEEKLAAKQQRHEDHIARKERMKEGKRRAKEQRTQVDDVEIDQASDCEIRREQESNLAPSSKQTQEIPHNVLQEQSRKASKELPTSKTAPGTGTKPATLAVKKPNHPNNKRPTGQTSTSSSPVQKEQTTNRFGDYYLHLVETLWPPPSRQILSPYERFYEMCTFVGVGHDDIPEDFTEEEYWEVQAEVAKRRQELRDKLVALEAQGLIDSEWRELERSPRQWWHEQGYFSKETSPEDTQSATEHLSAESQSMPKVNEEIMADVPDLSDESDGMASDDYEEWNGFSDDEEMHQEENMHKEQNVRQEEWNGFSDDEEMNEEEKMHKGQNICNEDWNGFSNDEETHEEQSMHKEQNMHKDGHVKDVWDFPDDESIQEEDDDDSFPVAADKPSVAHQSPRRVKVHNPGNQSLSGRPDAIELQDRKALFQQRFMRGALLDPLFPAHFDPQSASGSPAAPIVLDIESSDSEEESQHSSPNYSSSAGLPAKGSKTSSPHSRCNNDISTREAKAQFMQGTSVFELPHSQVEDVQSDHIPGPLRATQPDEQVVDPAMEGSTQLTQRSNFRQTQQRFHSSDSMTSQVERYTIGSRTTKHAKLTPARGPKASLQAKPQDRERRSAGPDPSSIPSVGNTPGGYTPLRSMPSRDGDVEERRKRKRVEEGTPILLGTRQPKRPHSGMLKGTPNSATTPMIEFSAVAKKSTASASASISPEILAPPNTPVATMGTQRKPANVAKPPPPATAVRQNPAHTQANMTTPNKPLKGPITTPKNTGTMSQHAGHRFASTAPPPPDSILSGTASSVQEMRDGFQAEGEGFTSGGASDFAKARPWVHQRTKSLPPRSQTTRSAKEIALSQITQICQNLSSTTGEQLDPAEIMRQITEVHSSPPSDEEAAAGNVTSADSHSGKVPERRTQIKEVPGTSPLHPEKTYKPSMPQPPGNDEEEQSTMSRRIPVAKSKGRISFISKLATAASESRKLQGWIPGFDPGFPDVFNKPQPVINPHGPAASMLPAYAERINAAANAPGTVDPFAYQKRIMEFANAGRTPTEPQNVTRHGVPGQASQVVINGMTITRNPRRRAPVKGPSSNPSPKVKGKGKVTKPRSQRETKAQKVAKARDFTSSWIARSKKKSKSPPGDAA